MRFWVTLLVVLVVGSGLVACGTVAARRTYTQAAHEQHSSPRKPDNTDADKDRDNPTGSRYDSDDNRILDFGRPATASVERTLLKPVRRYFAAAATADGGSACPVVYSLVAETLAEDQGRVLGRSGLSQAGCAAVLSKFFWQLHNVFVGDAKALRVARARVDGKHAMVFVNAGGGPLHRVFLQRERGRWKIRELWEREMP